MKGDKVKRIRIAVAATRAVAKRFREESNALVPQGPDLRQKTRCSFELNRSGRATVLPFRRHRASQRQRRPPIV